MKKLISIILAMLLAAVCALGVSAASRNIQAPAGAPKRAEVKPQIAICPSVPDIQVNTGYDQSGTNRVLGVDLSRNRKGKDTITMTSADRNCNWDGVQIGDTKNQVNRKLSRDFPLMYELKSIGNMNLYSDKEVPDHYLTVYFDDNDRVTMIIWQVNQVYTLD